MTTELIHRNLLIMKKYSLLIILSFLISIASAQKLVKSYHYSDGYGIIPKSPLERDKDIVIPFSITKNQDKKAGILYLNWWFYKK